MSAEEASYVLLPWLQSGQQEMMVAALEQLCEALLQTETDDRLLKTHPPSAYVPLLACLCQDHELSPAFLEVVVRTLTYYIQAVPHEVISCLAASKGAIPALSLRLETPRMHLPEESDLAQQIIKLFEELCKRDTKSLSLIGGASNIISFMSRTYKILHLDTIKSGFYILYKVIDKIDLNDNRLSEWFEFLSKFLKHVDNRIVEYSLHCLFTIIKMCNEKKISTEHLGVEKIVDNLLEMISLQLKMDDKFDEFSNQNDIILPTSNNKVGLSRTIIELILCIIQGSTQFLCNLLVNNKLSEILLEIINKYDGASHSIIQLIEGIYDQINERITYHSKEYYTNFKITPSLGFRFIHGRIYNEETLLQHKRYHESLMKAVKTGNYNFLKELLLSTDFDPKYKDKWGQTPLNWASSLGFAEGASLLFARGVDPNQGERASSLHYAAVQGHICVIESILKNEGLDYSIRDSEGFTILEKMKEFIYNTSDDNRRIEMEKLLSQIEKQYSDINTEVLMAKEYFVKRMTPILINLYLKSYKSSIRHTVLELINKVIRSYSNKDHLILVNEYYQDNILPYHLTRMVYRVLLQDTGENVLEALKLSLYLTLDKLNSKLYIDYFCRMGVKDLLVKSIERFSLLSSNSDIEIDDKIIPLYLDVAFSENKIEFNNLNSSLNLNQPYYMGDWNILNNEEGLNLYNEYCYVFILNTDTYKGLHVSILIRKGYEPTINPKVLQKHSIKKQLFNCMTESKNWKYKNDERQQSNETDYEAIEIIEKNVLYNRDLIKQLLERYSLMKLSLPPIIMPIPFPKLASGFINNIKNLFISMFSNHLRVHFEKSVCTSLKIPQNVKGADEKADIAFINEMEFLDISINKISGCVLRSENQIIYSTGPLIIQEGFKKIEVLKSLQGNISARLQQIEENPIKESICHRIIFNGKRFLELLDSFHEDDTKFSKNVSKLINAVKNNKSVDKCLENINKLFSFDNTKPTPYELLKSNFLKVLTELFQDKVYIEKFAFIFESNLPKLTKMIIQLLEQIEDLPTSYTLHSCISEHYLTRAFHVKTILRNCNDHDRYDVDPIPDLSKYNFLVMPLACSFSLKKSIWNLLQKLPWYNADKMSFNTVRQVLCSPYFVNIKVEESENHGGFFQWLGTNGYRTKFINPLKLDQIYVTTSENNTNMLSNVNNLFLYHSEIKKNRVSKSYFSVQGPDAFLTIHLKHPLGLIPKQYSLGRPLLEEPQLFSLINWRLMASIGGIEWDTLHVHENDHNLEQSKTGVYTWTLNINASLLHKVQNQGWLLFKIQEVLPKSVNVDDMEDDMICDNNYPIPKKYNMVLHNGFWLNYIEFYGTVYSVSETKQQEIKKNIYSYLTKFTIGTLVHHTLDCYSSTNNSRIIGKILQPLKNGTILVEWDNASGKCHMRHKMGAEDTYELILAQSINESVEGSSNFKPNTFTDSFIESKSSFDIQPESKDDIKNSFQDSISWIVDPNISVPLRTSSLSSQKNNKFSLFFNKENFAESNVNKVQNIYKKRKEASEDFQEIANFIKSETDYLDLHYENSDEENFQMESVIVRSNIKNRMEYLDGCSGGSKPTIQLSAKYPLDDQNKKLKSFEEAKKNFNLSKETKRKAHLGLSEGRREALKIKDNLDDIDMSDDSEFFEISQDPKTFLMQFQSVDNINKTKCAGSKNYYSSYTRNYKYKQNFNDIREASSKLKPINVLPNFPGLVQPIDKKSSQSIGQIQSNVEVLNYQQPKTISKVELNTKSKFFGYDPKQFRMKLEIQVPATVKCDFNSHPFIPSKTKELKTESCASLKNNKNIPYQKKTFDFILNNDSNAPIMNNILSILPLPDPIMNIYPVECISQIWHSQLTLYFGFCDKKIAGNCCKNCFYQKKATQNVKHDNKTSDNIIMVINLLNQLKQMQSKLNMRLVTTNRSIDLHSYTLPNFIWSDSYFISHYLCKNMLNQIEDVWSLLSKDTFSQWVIEWPLKYPFIFSYEIRVIILNAYWFGSSRSIYWLQQRTKPNVDYIRPTFRDDMPSPFHFLGRLKKHIARVPRPFYFGNTNITEVDSKSTFWSAVKDLFKFHSKNKEELEIQFENEEGTGLGPTLEFMNILSMEFMKIDNLMWVHNDTVAVDSDMYVNSENGLFPYPWPEEKLTNDILERFYILGIFIAKCLQDNRRIDILFSETFFKLLTNDILEYNLESYLNDFVNVYPMRGKFMKSLHKFCTEKEEIFSEKNKNQIKNSEEILKTISVDILGTTFEDLCIDMEFLPTTKAYGTEACTLLKSDTLHKDKAINFNEVSVHNAEHYLKETLDFTMNQGIRRQIIKMKDGFNEVFPIKCLVMFTASELKQLLCGEQNIKWTFEELYQYTEPTQGYTKRSQNYRNFLEVLEEMTQSERKLFIQFLTGCTSLPPGGLKNLKPRLTIVKKNLKDGGPYPSVNTCMHYLKLPEYNSKQEMKLKLMDASNQHGFHLN